MASVFGASGGSASICRPFRTRESGAAIIPAGITGLSYHRFKIAQTVTSLSPDLPPGPFVIVRLLPLAGSEPQYRVTSTADGHQRVMPESQITRPAVERERAKCG